MLCIRLGAKACNKRTLYFMQKGEEQCSSPKWLRNMNITEVMIIHPD